MSHSPELIQSILSKIQAEYPADRFKFAIEQAIPGTRMFPDILVSDHYGTLCCAVEIGYTRPEKLTAYRKDLKIPDVRWYDKAGNLHGDVLEKVVRVSVETEPQGFFAGYFLIDEIPCYSDECVQDALAEAAGIDLDKYGDWHDAIDDVFKDVCALNAYDEYLPCCTALTVVTDFARVWLHFFCDKCGEAEWVSKNSLCELQIIAYELKDLNGREFAGAHGDCIGADSQFHDSVTLLVYPPPRIETHPCTLTKWRAYRKADLIHEVKPPKDRNKDIVRVSDHLYAAPKGTPAEYPRSGTWQTVRLMLSFQKTVTVIWPDGTVQPWPHRESP